MYPFLTGHDNEFLFYYSRACIPIISDYFSMHTKVRLICKAASEFCIYLSDLFVWLYDYFGLRIIDFTLQAMAMTMELKCT